MHRKTVMKQQDKIHAVCGTRVNSDGTPKHHQLNITINRDDPTNAAWKQRERKNSDYVVSTNDTRQAIFWTWSHVNGKF